MIKTKVLNVNCRLLSLADPEADWKGVCLRDFILDLPLVNLILFSSGLFPPFEVLNDLLKKGKLDAGMSGVCEWKTFEINLPTYEVLVSDLQKVPSIKSIDNTFLQKTNSFDSWVSYAVSELNRS